MTIDKALRGIYKLGGIVLDERKTTSEYRLQMVNLCKAKFYCKILRSNEFIVLNSTGNADYDNVVVVSSYLEECNVRHTVQYSTIEVFR